MRQRISLMLVFLTLHAACVALAAAELRFRAQELKTRLDVGYAVRLIDMNGDHRLDIVIVDSDRIIWLENPNWEEHTLIQGQTKRHNGRTDIVAVGRQTHNVKIYWNEAR